MSRTAAAFLLLTLLTGALAALSIALRLKGYPLGGLGESRLDSLASAATFIPLAAIYAFAGMLMMILPIRAAGFVQVNAAYPVYAAALVLFATILGLQLARFGFGNRGALWALADWQFLFAGAIVVAHMLLDELRRNALLRTLAFVAFLAATLACLYWTFRL